ncbi:immunity protein YezG family protein [Paenibacillus senegalimassiliensis]|uniref:immunity protein YezG family protein n=1 Tax=Paenibacillus senegalimassiliensis TaxID=1737426 RepID=UPI00073FA210|nr:immunity protein YezG family protein [Paenibacillus senegalimassiliensis]
MIPEERHTFYFYAQISETGGGTYFFYNTPENEQNFKYSLEIPFNYYALDKEQYKLKDRTLFKLSDKLRRIFINYEQEPWYSFTISLDRKGKFKIHYDYTNWFGTKYSFDDQLLIWEYKYLGNNPNNEEEKDVINRYLEEYPKNPI